MGILWAIIFVTVVVIVTLLEIAVFAVLIWRMENKDREIYHLELTIKALRDKSKICEELYIDERERHKATQILLNKKNKR